MTPTLYLLRHAKAAPGAGDDHGRPLTAAGRRAAAAVGRWLTDIAEPPARIVTSSAERARDTAQLAAEAGGWSAPLVVTDDLYLAGPMGVLEVVAREGGDAERLLVVGHEPTWSGLVGGLTGAQVAFPTASVACVELHAGRWDEVDGAVTGRLRWLVPGRVLAELR